MIKKTINYEDFDGNPVSETYYFHLTRSELIEMETSDKEGYGEMLKKIVDEQNIPLMLKTFKQFILSSIGIKSEDGKHFHKDPQFAKDFEESLAYDALFTELCTNADEAANFISGLLPMNEQEKKEVMAKAKEQGYRLPGNT